MTSADVGRREQGEMGREASQAWRWPTLLTCWLLVVLVGGCATLTRIGPVTGRVVDAATGQPIAGAVVLGVWTKAGGLPGLPVTKLVDVRETETDGAGRFVLERPDTIVINEESVTVYKFGYVAWNNLFVFPTSQRRDSPRISATIVLQPFPADQSHRRHMSFIRNSRGAALYGHERIPKFSQAIEPETNLP